MHPYIKFFRFFARFYLTFPPMTPSPRTKGPIPEKKCKANDLRKEKGWAKKQRGRALLIPSQYSSALSKLFFAPRKKPAKGGSFRSADRMTLYELKGKNRSGTFPGLLFDIFRIRSREVPHRKSFPQGAQRQVTTAQKSRSHELKSGTAERFKHEGKNSLAPLA